MKEEFSVCSITNYYERGKLKGYSTANGQFTALNEEEPLEIPELFPIEKPAQAPRGKEEPLLVPELFPKKDRK